MEVRHSLLCYGLLVPLIPKINNLQKNLKRLIMDQQSHLSTVPCNTC